ncbi:ADP-dependent glucokinase/phosphofructokinase [Ruminococcaceae bacterium OttesenSCG-928-I18]|nr:ADP-dependent glucokinase/phosphofructokinase [Ruminococcaceae bacterium OttesenSCG-928-I18]
MKNDQIVMGFQNTVDFELGWEPGVIEDLIVSWDIQNREICLDGTIETQRDMVIALLAQMREGTGTERMVTSSVTTRGFASRFPYTVTLGGTAVRAAIAMANIGIPSTIHACSMNRHFRALVPKTVTWYASVPDEGEDFHPHVIVQFPAGARIRAGDIDITTRRPNRVIFAHDPPSVRLVIDESFKDRVGNAKVFLAASYNAMKDEALLRDRLKTTLEIMDRLPAGCVTVMEDGCFESPLVRRVVTETLGPRLSIFSLNEDELQDRTGGRIDILDPAAVANALELAARQIGSPLLICHSAYWALAYGQNPALAKDALQGGISMASTRFRLGDHFTLEDYRQTQKAQPCADGADFARQITGLLGADRVLCLPGFDLTQVAHPTTIGLGDAFVGGLLPQLLPKGERG